MASPVMSPESVRSAPLSLNIALTPTFFPPPVALKVPVPSKEPELPVPAARMAATPPYSMALPELFREQVFSTNSFPLSMRNANVPPPNTSTVYGVDALDVIVTSSTPRKDCTPDVTAIGLTVPLSSPPPSSAPAMPALPATSMPATASDPNTFIMRHFLRTARYLLIRFPTAPFDKVMITSSPDEFCLLRHRMKVLQIRKEPAATPFGCGLFQQEADWMMLRERERESIVVPFPII